MVYGNFATSLLDVASKYPDRPFLVDGNTTWTHGDVASLSAKMAGALLANGVRPGDRVVVQVEKSPENFALYLAALRAGAVFVPLNTAYTADEVAYFLSDADPTLFVHAPETGVSADIVCLTLGTDDKSEGSLLDAAKNAEPSGIVQRRSSDVAAILYTSGTTGRSKGAMLTHANLETNARALVELWGITDADVLLHALPIFHIHGLFVAMHTLMIAGGKVLFHRHFDPDQVVDDLPNATVMMGVPTFYSRLLDNKRFNAETAKDMRLFVSGSAPLTAEASNAFHKATGHRILERYGMSEAGMITSNPLDDTAGRVPGTVGYPLPDVQIRTAGEDDTGEVEIKGPNVFKGYWRNTEKTAEAFTKDGWFHTGDVGTLSEDGRLSLVGRAKDLIIIGGLNAYPKEIESVLDANPAITESAVVGAPHPDMGEGVVAFLVPQSDSTSANYPSKEQLEEIVAPLAKFKRPRHFVWIDALPRNAMGKVQKQLLRERCKETFGRG